MSIDWSEDKTWKRVFEPIVNTKPEVTGDPDEECDIEDGKQTLSDKKCLIKMDALEEIPEGF
jgi:hypothetical protein